MVKRGNVKGWMNIVDDFGNHRYIVTRIEGGCYYFRETTLLGNHKLRYNEREGRIEELDRSGWDVYSQYVYQVDFLPNA